VINHAGFDESLDVRGQVPHGAPERTVVHAAHDPRDFGDRLYGTT
jgi:hypothetical protein